MISTINSLFRLAGVALVSDRFEFTSPSEANYANESGLSQHSMEDINIMRLESTKTTGTSDPETVNSAQSFDFMEPEENVAVELEKHVKRRGSKHKRRPRKGSISQKVHFGSVEVVGGLIWVARFNYTSQRPHLYVPLPTVGIFR